MSKPVLDGINAMKPVCYDPSNGKYILYEEIVSGKQKIIPIETLPDNDFKKLVLERLRVGPDFTVQAMSGPPFTRNDVISAIERDEPFGRDTLQAEKTYLSEFLSLVQKNNK